MKTTIPFYHKVTKVKSNCADPLDITVSSKNLNWDGVLLEKGTSPYFHPKDIINPNFYFAMELDNSYSWSFEKDGEEIMLQNEPDDIWINPPNTPFTHNIDAKCDFIILNITKERMLKSFNSTIPDNIEFLNNYNIQDETLKNLINMLYHEVVNEGKNDNWYLDNIISLFANYFIRNYTNYQDLIDNAHNSSIISDSEMMKINEYISDNISESIIIDDLANLLSISKFHFLNEFKKYNGITPYQHILNIRIRKAKVLLKNKEQKITNIAQNLGFSDSSHFSNTFKKATGFSPKAFRKSLDN